MKVAKRILVVGASLSFALATLPVVSVAHAAWDGSETETGGTNVVELSAVESRPAPHNPIGEVPDAVVPASGLSESALSDLATMAEEDGISLEEAQSKYGWHEPFSRVVQQIRVAYPESFAGARIEDEGPWIAFKGEAPAASVDLLKGLTPLVDVRSNRPYTEAELDERLIRTHFALLASDLVADAESGYDIETGEITINVVPEDSATTDGGASPLGALVPDDPDMPVHVSVVAGIRAEDHYVRGGGSLSSCTAGFAVSRYIGHTLVYGLSTAGHCGDSQNYEGRAVLSFKAEHQGSWGDMQWHSSSERVSDDFHASASDIRDTAAVGFATEGQALCRYGKTTGKECSNVYQLNHCNGSRCRLTLMNTNEAAGGDSGGPWFYGTTAHGIHQGEKFYWGAKDLFTPVTYLDEGIGVSVITVHQP
jgi:hypothetical protein